MADAPQTCRYCGDTKVGTYNTPMAGVPLCERHAAELRGRMIADMDRIMGSPVQDYRLAGESEPATVDS